jgi:hypothetical protein
MHESAVFMQFAQPTCELQGRQLLDTGSRKKAGLQLQTPLLRTFDDGHEVHWELLGPVQDVQEE